MPDYAQQRGALITTETAYHTAKSPEPHRSKEPKRKPVYNSSSPPLHSCAHPLLVVFFCSAFDLAARSASAFAPRGRSSVGDSGGVANQPNAWPVFVSAVVAIDGGVEAADAALAASLTGARCCGKERLSLSDSADRVDSAD